MSQRQEVISLIPKKKKNLELLKNWRPVSLLNVDYKILTKVIAPVRKGIGENYFF